MMILFLLLKYQKSCLSLLHFSAMDALENALVQQLTHVAIQQIFHHCKLLYESVMILFLLLKYQKSCLSLLHFSAMDALENALVQQLTHVAIQQIFHHCKLLYESVMILILLLKYQKSCLSLLYFSAMGALENALVQQLAHVAMDIEDISLFLLLKYQKSCLWFVLFAMNALINAMVQQPACVAISDIVS